MAGLVTVLIYPGARQMVERIHGTAAAAAAGAMVLGRAVESAPVVTGEYRANLTQRMDGTTAMVGGTAAHSTNVEHHHDTLKNALHSTLFGGQGWF